MTGLVVGQGRVHLTVDQLRRVVFDASTAYARALLRRETVQAAEHIRLRALERSLADIAEGSSGQG